jgi:hypothetical protein
MEKKLKGNGIEFTRGVLSFQKAMKRLWLKEMR